MKRFVFALDSVMKYRDYEKDQAEVELGRALAAEGAIQTQIDSLVARDKAASEAAHGTKDFSAIQASYEFHALMKQKTAVLKEQLAAAQSISNEKRSVMRIALQKSQSVHKLYDKQLEEYNALNSREETQIVDDIATTRFNGTRN